MSIDLQSQRGSDLKLAIAIGTRPEIIKLSPMIRLCESRKIDYILIHTNQHYSYEMDRIFFDDLELPHPTVNLNVGSGSHSYQTGRMLEGIEKILIKEKADITVIEGDTNTTLAGALASAKLQIPVAHVESGMRAFDMRLPEEINRILTDHCAHFLFCPTKTARNNLLCEGIKKSKTYLVGDTLADATLYNIGIAEKRSNILRNLKIKPKEYFLLTTHRAGNVDEKEKLLEILKAVKRLSKLCNISTIFPIHPRTKKRVNEFRLEELLETDNVKVIDPLGYLDFLILEKNALVTLTDSGGVQEECCHLKTPCVTLRDETEWEETVKVGANILAGTNEKKIVESVRKMLKSKRNWKHPLGNGKATERILSILLHKYRAASGSNSAASARNRQPT
jgi:UDP-N-acetylglucosamine 2-epimerase (non-hydrolysing)